MAWSTEVSVFVLSNSLVSETACVAPSCTLTPTTFPLAGILVTLDGFMNIAMEQTEEFVDGQLKQKYGDCFIRGNNGG